MKKQSQTKKQIVCNLTIFSFATLGSGWLGVALDRVTETANPQQGLGMLLWILIPMGTGLLLRVFGRDGWQDSGFKPNLKSAWKLYITALLIFPLVSFLMLAPGLFFGAFSLPGFSTQGTDAFFSLVVASFATLFVKNIFEEFAWRGYLTARFDALRLNPFVNHLLTGLIWAGWHIPYWLYFVDVQKFTSLDKPTFIVLGIFTLVTTAITYGELRLLSNTVWTTVILHSVANAITATLLLNGFIHLNGGLGVVFSPGNDGIIHSILFSVIGIGLYRYRMWQSARAGGTRLKNK